MAQQQLLPGQIQQQQQQIQAGGQENQMRAQQIADQQATTKAMQAWDGKDLNELPGLILKNGGSAQAVFGSKAQILKLQQDSANLSKDQLANQKIKNDYFAQAIDNVKNLPPDQQPAAFEQAKQEAVQKGYVDPQQAQQMQYQGPQQLDILEKTLMGHSAVIENSIKQQNAKSAAETAASRTQSANTGAERLKQEEDPNSALNTTKVAMAGKEAQAKLPSEEAIARVRQEVTQTFQNNKDAKDKIESNVLKPYQDKVASIDELQSALDQASSGNVTAARGVLLKLIGVTNPDGTKRYNEAEANRLLQQGSIPQRLAGSLKNALTGNNWTPQMISDMKAFADEQGKVAAQTLNNGIDNTNKLYGSNVGQGLKTGGAQGGGQTQSGASPKTLSMASVQKAAKDHNISIDEALKQAKAAGYEVK